MAKLTTTDSILAVPVDLERLIRKLDFAEENLVQATREQASLFIEASRYRVRQLRARLRTESAYEAQCSDLSLKFRKYKDADGKKTLTEGAIKVRVSSHPSVIEAKREVDKVAVREEFSKLLVEAFRHRKDACKILAEVLGAEASAEVRSERSQMERNKLKKLRRRMDERYPGQEE